MSHGKIAIEKQMHRASCERPILGKVKQDPSDPGHGHENDPAWLETSVKLPDRGRYIINKLKRLSDNDAVKGVSGKVLSRIQVRNDCCVRIRGVDVQHLGIGDTCPAETVGVSTVLNFENPTRDITRIGGQEILNIKAIDWETAAIRVATDRHCTPQIPPSNVAHRRSIKRKTPSKRRADVGRKHRANFGASRLPKTLQS